MLIAQKITQRITSQKKMDTSENSLALMTDSPASLIAAFKNYKLFSKTKLLPLIKYYQKSKLFHGLSEKYAKNPESLQLDEIICYAIGRASDPDKLDHALEDMIKQNPAMNNLLTGSKNVVKLLDILPLSYFESFSRFYAKSPNCEVLAKKIKDNFQEMQPEEMLCLFGPGMEIVEKHYREIPPFMAEFLEYLLNPKKMFEFLSIMPQDFLFECGISFQYLPPEYSPSWIKKPEHDYEILLSSLIAKDIYKINPEKLRAAINTVAAQNPQDENINHCLNGLRATLAAIETGVEPAAKWEKITNLARNRIFINLSGMRLEGANLRGANLEYTLLAPVFDFVNNKPPQASESHINLRNADLRDVKFPLMLTNVDLSGAQLGYSTILDYPFYSKDFTVDSSIFSELTSANAKTQLDLIDQKIKQDPKLHEARHTLAKLLLDKVTNMSDKTEAASIYETAFAHPIFSHTSTVSKLYDKTGSLFTHQVFYPTRSQSILMEFKNKSTELSSSLLRV